MAHNDLVQSLARGLEILERVARSDEGVTLQELARELGVQPTTAHNLARTLAARGFLRKTARPVRYCLGPAIPELAEAHASRETVRRGAGAVCALAARLPGATVTLAQPLGGDVRILLRMSAERPGVLERPSSWALHPYASASALLFQAFWTGEERAAYRRRHPLSEVAGHGWESAEALDRFLEEVRRLGFAARPPGADGILKVAAPVWGLHHDLRAALGASTPTTMCPNGDAAAVIDAVVSAARELDQYPIR